MKYLIVLSILVLMLLSTLLQNEYLKSEQEAKDYQNFQHTANDNLRHIGDNIMYIVKNKTLKKPKWRSTIENHRDQLFQLEDSLAEALFIENPSQTHLTQAISLYQDYCKRSSANLQFIQQKHLTTDRSTDSLFTVLYQQVKDSSQLSAEYIADIQATSSKARRVHMYDLWMRFLNFEMQSWLLLDQVLSHNPHTDRLTRPKIWTNVKTPTVPLGDSLHFQVSSFNYAASAQTYFTINGQKDTIRAVNGVGHFQKKLAKSGQQEIKTKGHLTNPLTGHILIGNGRYVVDVE